jgi:homoserine kinase type II
VVTTLTDDVLRSVLARFGMPDARVELSFDASTRNDNLLISRPGGEQFVLRRYRRNRDIDRIAFHLRFQQWLFESGYPAPSVVPATDGTALVLTDAGPFALSPFMEGDHYDYDRAEHRVEAGRRLAEYHLLTQQFTESMGAYELVQPIREWWSDPERELADLEAHFRDADISEEMRQVREWISQLHENLPLQAFDALPAGWIHNDYHGRNVIFRGDRIEALLDYDKIQIAPYALEVAHAMFTFGRPFRGSDDVLPDFVRTFLAGYETIRPLADIERSALLALMGMESPPFTGAHGMVARDEQDPLEALRFNIASQRARRANAATLAGHV